MTNTVIPPKVVNPPKADASSAMADKEAGKTLPPSPEYSTNIIGRVLFSWTNNLVYKGATSMLKDDEVWDLSEHDRSMVIFERYQKLLFSSDGRQRSTLPRALYRNMQTVFLWGAIMRAVAEALQFAGPLLLSHIVSFMSDRSIPSWQGYVYAVALFGAFFLRSLLTQHSFHSGNRMAMIVAGSLIHLVYRKSLRLSSAARRNQNVGKITNLMAVDSFKLMMLMTFVNNVWTAPLVLIAAIGLIIAEIGPSALMGPAVILLTVPMQRWLLKQQSRLRTQTAAITDERVKAINEFITGIRVVKYYAWEELSMTRIAKIRSRELALLRRQAYLRGVTELVLYITPIAVSIAVFGVYVGIGNTLSPAKAYSVLALFNIMQLPLRMFPMTLFSMVDGRTSLKRMVDFMASDELQPDAVKRDDPADPQGVVYVKDGQFLWEKNGGIILDNLSFRVAPGTITAVVGAVGSGKSSLTSALVGEMVRSRGEVHVTGRVAYVPQQAWVKNATLRDNILWGFPYDEKRYKETLRICELTSDLAILTAGDQTEIGERGINLSGGQKQRVSIARAVYCNADVYILDDCLSALDAHVSKRIFDNVIMGALAGKTRVLVTHALYLLANVDQVLLLKDGRVTETGTFTDLLTLPNGEFGRLVRDYSTSSSSENKGGDAPAAVSTPTASEVQPAAEGSIAESAPQAASNGVVAPASALTSAPTNAAAVTAAATAASASTISPAPAVAVGGLKGATEAEKAKAGQLMSLEDRKQGSVGIKVYKDYFKAARSPFILALMINGYLLAQAVRMGNDWWLGFWAADRIKPYPGIGFYLGIYGASAVLAGLIAMVRVLSTAELGFRSATTLQRTIIRSVLRAPMSFFDTTPVGRILNRFGRDQDTVDQTLPQSLSTFLTTFLVVVGTFVLLASVTPLYLTVFVPLGFAYYYVMSFYMRSSRELKRFDSVSRSPLYAHIGETLSGLATIRAYLLQNRFVSELSERLDTNMRAFFASMAVGRWLAVRLELMSAILIGAAAAFGVLARDAGLDPALVGFSLSWALQITAILSFTVRMATDVELQMNAVERIDHYAKHLPQEAPLVIPRTRPDALWPVHGGVVVQDLEMRYRPELPAVLHRISFDIKPMEKVGIVGRTGSGKSSLTLALLRIVEPAFGTVFIDGVDVGQIGLHDLRTKIAIIPQDPVLFTGTIRSNLDPFDEHSDDALLHVLELVNMKAAVMKPPEYVKKDAKKPAGALSIAGPAAAAGGPAVSARSITIKTDVAPADKSNGKKAVKAAVSSSSTEPEAHVVGVNMVVSEGGENFSVGQRQLLCLARALLRRPKILLMDEATASVDVETDAFIQKMVKEQFNFCTVLTIAHRLHSIIQNDRVMVLSHGNILEYDSPLTLMDKPGGSFAALVNENGADYATKMRQLASARGADIETLVKALRNTEDE